MTKPTQIGEMEWDIYDLDLCYAWEQMFHPLPCVKNKDGNYIAIAIMGVN